MSKIIIVSNRLPMQVIRRKGNLSFKPSAGGLATGVSTIHQKMKTLWIGWPGLVSGKPGEREEIHEHLLQSNMQPVFLSKDKVEKYYQGFSNRTIWPLFHYFQNHVMVDEPMWRAYTQVNRQFSDTVLKYYEPGDYIWVHDYQLMLVPGLLRDQLENAGIGFFLHIPFPSYELFRTLPWRRELLDGLLGADLIGFHIFDYVRHFLSSVTRLMGIEHELGMLTVDGRKVRADAFPMGIDYKKYAGAGQKSRVKKEVKKYLSTTGQTKIILSIDRLDYSKGLLQRLKAFHQFLHHNPDQKGKVQLILLVVPSRSQVESYKILKQQLDEIVGRINGDHGTLGWTPIWYLYRSMPFDSLAALYQIADICMVTPFRDGMNLVAKEFVACKENDRGVLILSEMAGAAGELTEALIVNPNDINSIVSALETALNMEEEEQISRMQTMQQFLNRYDISRWAIDFVDSLRELQTSDADSKVKFLDNQLRAHVVESIVRAQNAVLLLDYDGTLVPFASRPELATPSDSLLRTLARLNSFKSINLIVISGRDKQSLATFFREPLNKVAEHGAWIQFAGEEWHTLEPFDQDWKEDIRNILDQYVTRTPGSFIEEKDFSLVWHYRKADVGLGEVRAHDLTDTLQYMTGNLNLQVLEGNKIVEVKNSGINKGRTARHLVNHFSPDVILAVGDDWTDEDTFKALPEKAITIKVTNTQTAAKYYIKSYRDTVSLLNQINERKTNETTT